MGIGSKVIRQPHYGFAVRCEAVALARRQTEELKRGATPRPFLDFRTLSN